MMKKAALVAVAVLTIALVGFGCGRDSLLILGSQPPGDGGAGGSAAGGSAPGGTGGSAGSEVPPPPPPPPCSLVSFSHCQPWPEPVVVSLPSESGLDADVAWHGAMHLVVYTQADDGSTSLVAVDRQAQLLWRESVGQTDDPRVTWNAPRGRGLVVGSSGLRWLGGEGHVLGAFLATTPWAGVKMNADAAPTSTGFALIVSPKSDPGGESNGTFAWLGAEPGDVAWQTFHDDSPNPSIEHATGSDGLVTRFGFETLGLPMQILQFEWDGAKPVGPVAPPYDLGSSTTFTDAMVTGDGLTYFGQSSSITFSLLEVHDAGLQTGHVFVAEGQVRGIHLEHLATAAGLAEIVIAVGGLVAGQMAVVAFDQVSGEISEPLLLGAGTRNPRTSRTSRGLAVTWVDPDRGVMLNELDCCADP